MASNNDVIMDGGSFDPLFDNMCDNYDNICGCSLAYSAHCPRSPSIFLSECKESYAKRMEKQNNRMNKNKPVITTNSFIVLEYTTLESQNGQVSKAANNTSAVY